MRLRSRRNRRCAWREAEMGDSIWKKEISLKRKSKPDSDPDFDLGEPAKKESLLKKEISFSRKSKEPKAPKPPKAEKQSLLKKEISFSRKPKPESEAPALPVPLDESTRESIWKREIGFGKKQKTPDQKTVEQLMAQAAAAVAPGELVPGDERTMMQPTELAEAVV